MNRYERRPTSAGEAEVEYLDGEIRILRPGVFVRCAATGVPIPLEDLRYGTSTCRSLMLHPRQSSSGSALPSVGRLRSR